jgi:sensor histidine kinase YesM
VLHLSFISKDFHAGQHENNPEFVMGWIIHQIEGVGQSQFVVFLDELPRTFVWSPNTLFPKSHLPSTLQCITIMCFDLSRLLCSVFCQSKFPPVIWMANYYLIASLEILMSAFHMTFFNFKYWSKSGLLHIPSIKIIEFLLHNQEKLSLKHCQFISFHLWKCFKR